jgi:hypothetical protein
MDEFDDFNEYGTYEQEDDLFQLNQREADDYLNEGEGVEPEPDDEAAAVEDFDMTEGPEME